MRVWKTFQGNLTIRGASSISERLAAWVRETLTAVHSDRVEVREVRTNLSGFDEGGYPSPDFDWVEVVAAEFPHHQVRVTYQLPSTRQEATAPYGVQVRWGMRTRRAWVEVQRPGHWIILED